MADKQGIQQRLFDATGDPELAQSIATALCDGEGYRNIPETTVNLMEESAKKAACASQSVQSREAYRRAASKMGGEDSGKMVASVIPAFARLRDFLGLLLGEAKYTTGAVIYGSAGIGKTKTTLEELSLHGVDYAYFNTYSTPLSLYEILFLNRDRTVVLDDVNNLLKDPKSVAILKAATFSAVGERMITYSSTSKVLEEHNLPSSFIFKGRVIILVNEIPATLRETFQALLSRVYSYEVSLTTEEKFLLVDSIFLIDKPFGITLEEWADMRLFLKSILSFANTHRFNVRTAFRAAEVWKLLGQEKAKPLIMELFECEPKFTAFMALESLAGERNLSVKQRVEIWQESIGYSRRAYFEVKARYHNTRYGKSKAEGMMLESIASAVENKGGLT